MQQLRVKRFESWDDIRRVSPAWDELLADSASRTIFLTWEWLTAWWNVYGSSRELFLLGCLASDGSLVGVAPLYRMRCRAWPGLWLRVLRLVGDGTYDSDNLDLVIRRGNEGSVVEAFLDWLLCHRAEWDVLELNAIPSESRVFPLLVEKHSQHRWPCQRRETPHAVLPLPSDWQSYLASLSANMRSSISRRMQRLERTHAMRLRRCDKAQDLPEFLDLLFPMHTARWQARGQEGAFSGTRRKKFYSEVTEKCLAQGWLAFWLLELDGRAAALELGFQYSNAYYFLQGGFDTGLSSLGVGIVLKAKILQALVQEGVRCYDFLGGGEDYKLRWGAELRSYHNLRCALPGSKGALYLKMETSLGRTKEWVRARIPATTWELLRKTYRRFKPYESSPSMDRAPSSDEK